MPHASLLARAQVVEANERFKLWGLSGGEMQVREADFCEDPEVGAVLRRANVVLVNNEVCVLSYCSIGPNRQDKNGRLIFRKLITRTASPRR